MNDLEKAARMALEAICESGDFLFNFHDCEPNNEREMQAYQAALAANEKAFNALRQALSDSVEKPAQQEPVDWEAVAADQAMTIAMMKAERKPWVGLDHDDIHALVNEFFYRGMQPSGTHFANFGRAIEAKLKEKNA
jgi:hypothetical protein